MTSKIPMTATHDASEHVITLAPEFAACLPDTDLPTDAPDDMYWAADDAPMPGIAYDPDGPCDPSLAAYLDDLTDHGITIVWPVGVAVASLAADGYTLAAVSIGHRPQPMGTINYYVERDDLPHVTVLCSPAETTAPQERLVQRHNYDTFISTMASIFEKYGADILRKH